MQPPRRSWLRNGASHTFSTQQLAGLVQWVRLSAAALNSLLERMPVGAYFAFAAHLIPVRPLPCRWWPIRSPRLVKVGAVSVFSGASLK